MVVHVPTGQILAIAIGENLREVLSQKPSGRIHSIDAGSGRHRFLCLHPVAHPETLFFHEPAPALLPNIL